jgi:hypothetical protein
MLTFPFQRGVAGRAADLVAAGSIAAVERILRVVVAGVDSIIWKVLVADETIAGPDLPVALSRFVLVSVVRPVSF